jgi:hypothetical protein
MTRQTQPDGWFALVSLASTWEMTLSGVELAGGRTCTRADRWLAWLAAVGSLRR